MCLMKRYEQRERDNENIIGKIKPQAGNIKREKTGKGVGIKIKNNCHVWS